MLSQIGFDLKKWLWNKGGMGIGNNDTLNAFGKIEVFGNDSVQLCIIDENNVTVACHTVKNNSIISGVNNVRVMNDLVTIYPNPAHDKIRLEWNQKYGLEKIQQVKIVDVNGKEMYIDKTILTSPLIEIPIQQLPIGVYLLSVETEQSFSVQKL